MATESISSQGHELMMSSYILDDDGTTDRDDWSPVTLCQTTLTCQVSPATLKIGTLDIFSPSFSKGLYENPLFVDAASLWKDALYMCVQHGQTCSWRRHANEVFCTYSSSLPYTPFRNSDLIVLHDRSFVDVEGSIWTQPTKAPEKKNRSHYVAVDEPNPLLRVCVLENRAVVGPSRDSPCFGIYFP